MTVRLPPFKSIEAFVVAAQAGSFTSAAATLNITVPAVSRRIQALEADLGTRLFHRTARRLTLSAPGETYLSRLAPAIEAIRGASETVRAELRRNSVKISLPPSFAAGWLVPRLTSFYARHRDIQIDLQSSTGHVNFAEMEVDLAIERSTWERSMPQAERLLDVEAFPVCSAGFLGGALSPCSARELAKFPLLASGYESDQWPDWFHAVGIDDPPRALHFFDQFHLLYQAAVSGLGIALGEDVTVKLYLDDRRLVRPSDVSVKLTKSYYLRTRCAGTMPRPVAIFRRWLSAEAAVWRAESVPSQWRAN